MTRITRDQFVNTFKNDGKDVSIDVHNLTQETLDELQKAGIKPSDLNKVAGKDGKISGDAEYKALFDTVDRLEKGEKNAFFETIDDKNVPTPSGHAYEALKSEVDRSLANARAQGVFQSTPAVPKNDPYAKHIAEVRAELQKAKLPTSANGATVIIIGEGDTPHARAIARTVGGPAGLARGADVRMPDPGNYREDFLNSHPYYKEIQNSKSTLTLKDIAKLAVVQNEADLYAARKEIEATRQSLPADGKTRIGNISWGGHSPISVAMDQLNQLKPGDPILKKAILEWELKNKPEKFDKTNPIHTNEVSKNLVDQIAAEIKTLQNDPINENDFNALKAGLESELGDSRKKGLLVFNAAGNDRQVAKDIADNPKYSTIVFDSVKNMITVGAADLTSPKNAKMWEGSAKGKSIEIAAPGVNLPVGENSSTETGTSFATPYAASVAALMVAANPKITPDAIESILTSGRVTNDLPGDRDGAGLLDPVKAVKEAKAWKP